MNDINTSDFLGTGWSFPPSFNKETGTVNMVSGEEDIQQSLGLLFSTSAGERVMFPAFGSSLHNFLFEQQDQSVITYMKDLVHDMVIKYEPRISLNNIEIDDTQAMDGVMLVSLDYTVLSTNRRNNVVFPLYKSEGTLVSSTK